MAEPASLAEGIRADGTPQLATGGVLRDGGPIRVGGDTCAIPAFIACECGRDLHIAVNLSPAQIEAAASRVLLDMQRRAVQWGAHRAPIGG